MFSVNVALYDTLLATISNCAADRWFLIAFQFTSIKFVSCHYVCVFMFSIGGQTAGPIEAKLSTRIRLYPGSASVKVKVYCGGKNSHRLLMLG